MAFKFAGDHCLSIEFSSFTDRLLETFEILTHKLLEVSVWNGLFIAEFRKELLIAASEGAPCPNGYLKTFDRFKILPPSSLADPSQLIIRPVWAAVIF